MEGGYSRMDDEIHPQLLDLIPKERNWFVKKDDDDYDYVKGLKRSHENGDEKKLELRLGPPGVEDWSLSDAHKNYKSVEKASNKSAPAPVVGWPPIRSFRKNIASSSSSKQALSPSDSQNEVVSNKAKQETMVKSCNTQKGFFVKINMIGVPIGRKVDLNAYDSYEKLSVAVDQLFRGLLAAQKDKSGGWINGKNEEDEKAISVLLDGQGEYSLVYEDNEGDKMLVGDVPWHMFVSTVKRLRVIKSSEISNICLGGKQEKLRL
ncbi:auxin-responsive protein IAA18-like isoform X2 [Rutidosis leptorrhynchoides]|uniref:auxin-responsive protein IAA18-like isoform X2 n=1 Tax=Rutidosis leptorrhynchoides TaxID=125765 RepID=UPI003A99C38C